MEHRSSTSSSKGLPWAAILAAAIVLAGDRALDLPRIWGALAAATPEEAILAWNVATSQASLRGVANAPRGERRVLVVGSSRAGLGFDRQLASEALPRTAFATIVQAGLGPFEIRSYAEEMRAAHPDVVVFFLSEFETHRPLHLEPIPGSSAASVAAVADLVAETGWGFAFRNRTTLSRIVVASMLSSYRFRDVLRHVGADRLRTFTIEPRLSRKPPRGYAVRPVAMWDGSPTVLPHSELRGIRERLGGGSPAQLVALLMLRDVSPGRHATIQLDLLRRAIERLRASGVAVVIVETPVHPAAVVAVNPAARREFAEFALSLVKMYGIVFVPLEAQESFQDGDFIDLLHVNSIGARKLTSAMVRALRSRPAAGALATDPLFSPTRGQRRIADLEGQGCDVPGGRGSALVRNSG